MKPGLKEQLFKLLVIAAIEPGSQGFGLGNGCAVFLRGHRQARKRLRSCDLLIHQITQAADFLTHHCMTR